MQNIEFHRIQNCFTFHGCAHTAKRKHGLNPARYRFKQITNLKGDTYMPDPTQAQGIIATLDAAPGTDVIRILLQIMSIALVTFFGGLGIGRLWLSRELAIKDAELAQEKSKHDLLNERVRDYAKNFNDLKEAIEKSEDLETIKEEASKIETVENIIGSRAASAVREFNRRLMS